MQVEILTDKIKNLNPTGILPPEQLQFFGNLVRINEIIDGFAAEGYND